MATKEELMAPVKAPTISGGKSFNEAMGIQAPYLEKQSQLQSGITAAEGSILRGQQEQKEIQATGEDAAQKGYAAAEKGAMQQYGQKLEAEPLPAFIPTKDTAQDIAGLFSLIGVIGMIAGRGDAQKAMGAMNGMLEGHRKGRADLYKQQASEFDKNFKSMMQKHAEFRKEMEDAVKLAATDKEAGMTAAKMAAVKAGSNIINAQIDKGDLVGAYKTVDESKKATQNAYTAYTAQKRHAEDLAARERHHKESIAAANERARLAAIAKSASGGGAAAGQVERMVNAMTQVSGAVRAVADLPVTTTAPTFGQKEFKGLFSAPLSVLNQKMSKETSQMMQGRMVGVARNLASLETGGAATGLAGLTDSIQAGIAIPSGAKLHVALDRLAEMRRIVEDSARGALASSKYTDEQKQLIKENVAIVQKAIPFTLEDVRDATVAGQGKSPAIPKESQSLSFTDYVGKYGVGKEKEQPSSAADPVTGLPTTNEKGWALHNDGQGNYAYVSPNGIDYEELDGN